jgi:glutathione synthase/RimK-type ligase-like ATP-grasp enzyme
LNSPTSAVITDQAVTPFLGLAPFLRVNIAGTDLLPLGQEMLAQAQQNPNDAPLWMNLSVVMQCIRQRDIGLAIQGEALNVQRIFHLPAAVQPAKLRLLVLMLPGDIAANTPIDCLLENSDVDLVFYYVTEGEPLSLPVPEHDVVLVGLSESDAHRDTLQALERALAHWPKPVINAPQHIPNTGRDAASRLLQDAPGLHIPTTQRAARATLRLIASGALQLAEQFGCTFPIILRPYDSQAGRDLARINSAEELTTYLAQVTANDFFLARFIDYSGKDGLFRKFRIALVDGQPFACHMAVSSHWMVHYVNAGMYEEAHKREEEAAFMEHFADFAQRHRAALDAIYNRTGLDYLLLDCAETREGELLIFEIDHTMVVHAMDPEHLFPYKQTHMKKVQDAFRNYLLRLSAA